MPKKNNPYVKIANEVTEYTPEQILELDMCASDAVHCISKYFHIQHPVKGSVPFNLHPYQAEIIHRAQHNYYNIVTIARQGGKTTTIGAFLLWYAMFTNDATVLVVSNKGDNAKEVIERIKFMYESCPLWLKPGVTDDGYNKHSLRFDNGSRIISQATSENSGRGLSISLLFCYGGNNTVEVMDDEGNQFKLTLDELYEYMV